MSQEAKRPSRASLSERLLLLLSRKPGTADPAEGHEEQNPNSALSQLRDAFPEFESLIAEKDVLDFGCGEGWQAVAIVQNGARFVLGLDSNSKTLAKARQLAQQAGAGERIKFAENLNGDARRFDIVISQNSMEHFPDPAGALEQMKRALKPGGKILITFGPPWFAPYGAHMGFFTRVPWLNLLFPERTVMRVRSLFRQDGAARYEDVESGLNKMSVAKFEKTLSDTGLRADRQKYRCVKRLDALARLPLVRELLVNQVDCIVTEQPGQAAAERGSPATGAGGQSDSPAHAAGGPITVVSFLALNPRKWGSLEEQAAFLSAALRDRGWRSVLFFDALPESMVLARLKESGAEIREIPHGSPLTSYPALATLLRNLRPSIVHFRLGNAFSPQPIVAKLSGARAVFLTEEYCRQKEVAPGTKVKCYLWDRTVLRALGTRVIAVSDDVRQALVGAYEMRPGLIRVLLHGVNTKRFTPSEVSANAEVRHELGIPDEDRVVVCAAHLVPEKGVRDLLTAAKQILSLRQDVTIVIAGDGRAAGELRQTANDLGISGKVRFIGLRSDVDRLFAMADAVAVPSVCDEAAGLVLLEAMACGRPVVATRVGGIPEYVKDGKTAILVARGSPDQLTQALLSLLNSPSLATTMGRAGRAAAETEFSMERWTSDTLAMYDAALNLS